MTTVDLSHTRSVEDTLLAYKVTEDEGLAQERVLELRRQFGYNGGWMVLRFVVFPVSCCCCLLYPSQYVCLRLRVLYPCGVYLSFHFLSPCASCSIWSQTPKATIWSFIGMCKSQPCRCLSLWPREQPECVYCFPWPYRMSAVGGNWGWVITQGVGQDWFTCFVHLLKFRVVKWAVRWKAPF